MKKLMYLLSFIAVLSWSCKKKDDSSSTPGGSSGGAALVIQNGAGFSAPGTSVSYTAVFVDASGAITPATGVTWTSSNQQVATISGNTISAVGGGQTKITASASYNGSALTASVPLGVGMPSVFAVLPGVIAIPAGAEAIQMKPVYIGTGNPGNYTYTSSNSAVVSVSSTGLVSFPAAGEATITVTAPGLDGSPSVQVPVLVVGAPPSVLPVTKVVVTPGVSDVFIDEEITFTAKAYNSAGAEVKNAPVAWSVSDAKIVSIDQNGKVKGLLSGTSDIKATIDGIIGTASVQVVPKTVIEITPYMASIPASGTRQFTAKTYNVTRVNGNYVLTQITNPSDMQWQIPTTGISMFDVATVNSTGLVTMKSSAMVGMSTVVTAFSPASPKIDGSAAVIMVSNCDCGAGTGVTQISTDKDTYNLSMMSPMPVQMTVTTVPAGASVNYCTDSPSTVSVSPDGMISPLSPGTAVVTICNGNTIKKVTVVVGQ